MNFIRKSPIIQQFHKNIIWNHHFKNIIVQIFKKGSSSNTGKENEVNNMKPYRLLFLVQQEKLECLTSQIFFFPKEGYISKVAFPKHSTKGLYHCRHQIKLQVALFLMYTNYDSPKYKNLSLHGSILLTSTSFLSYSTLDTAILLSSYIWAAAGARVQVTLPLNPQDRFTEV